MQLFYESVFSLLTHSIYHSTHSIYQYFYNHEQNIADKSTKSSEIAFFSWNDLLLIFRSFEAQPSKSEF